MHTLLCIRVSAHILRALDIVTDLTELSEWLVNAFNGEWLRIEDPVPMAGVDFDKREGAHTWPGFGSK